MSLASAADSDSEEPLLRFEEAGRRTLTGVRTIARLVRDGEIPSVQVVGPGGRTGQRVRASDVERFCDRIGIPRTREKADPDRPVSARRSDRKVAKDGFRKP